MRPSVWMALPLMLLAAPVAAADLFGPAPSPFSYGAPGPGSLPPEPPPGPRYFPRGDGSESETVVILPRRIVARCQPRRVPVPTNLPDDPSYVGSPYGLGKPSYYGFTPPPGIDDPYGRSVLPYCR